ncbi:hypothetical protein LEN26_002705 [Aphanomyces euteiches]|nr:hypothetical protein LEN26_002705 [Aphanomyces euteiches]
MSSGVPPASAWDPNSLAARYDRYRVDLAKISEAPSEEFDLRIAGDAYGTPECFRPLPPSGPGYPLHVDFVALGRNLCGRRGDCISMLCAGCSRSDRIATASWSPDMAPRSSARGIEHLLVCTSARALVRSRLEIALDPSPLIVGRPREQVAALVRVLSRTTAAIPLRLKTPGATKRSLYRDRLSLTSLVVAMILMAIG